MRRKIVGDILTVRHSVVIGAELIVEPDIDRNTRIVAIMVRTARIIAVNILEHLNAGNVFRVRSIVRLGKVIARHPRAVDNARRIFGVVYTVIRNRLRRITCGKSFRKYGL